MSNVGRNAPCPCGSGKKYKQCHGPIDAELATAQCKLKQAPDTLLPKLMEALDRFSGELGNAMQQFWNGAYAVQDVAALDEHEDRGSERFLTWFAFDSTDAEGQTPVQRLIAAPEGLELEQAERTVLAGWNEVRLQPFEVVAIHKGRGVQVRPLFGTDVLHVEDHKATKRLEVGEVLITHLIPAGDTTYIAGAAAQLTADTATTLREYTALHLDELRLAQPDVTYADLIRTRSAIFNHFVMALPREEQESGKLDELVAMTRATLNVTAQQVGLQRARSAASSHLTIDEADDDDQLVAVADDQSGYDGLDD